MQEQGTERGGGRARRSAPAAGRCSAASPCRTSSGACSTACILCNARAMGEFGAVSVVSGHIRGLTNTMPLHVEILYNEYNFVGRVRGRLAARAAGAGHAGAEDAARMAIAARERALGGLAEEIAMSIEVRRPHQDASAPSRRSTTSASTSRDGRAGRAARPVGLGQDDAAAHHRRPRVARPRRACCFDGEDATDARRARAPGRLRVPALRAVPAHDACSRTSPSACACGRARVRPAEARDPRARRRAARAGPARLARATAIRTSSPAASASASRWRARWRSSRSVLLLDEPFGALDAKVRKELRRWLRRLHDEIARHQRLRHPRPGRGARGRRPRRAS